MGAEKKREESVIQSKKPVVYGLEEGCRGWSSGWRTQKSPANDRGSRFYQKARPRKGCQSRGRRLEKGGESPAGMAGWSRIKGNCEREVRKEGRNTFVRPEASKKKSKSVEIVPFRGPGKNLGQGNGSWGHSCETC